jgi:hypothetical protein
MRVKVIINPAAGKPEPILNVFNDESAPAGIDCEVDITHRSGDGVAATPNAVV